MRSLPVGIIFVMMVLLYAVGSFDNWLLYGNDHSIILVIGGTLAISFLSTPYSALKKVYRDLFDLFKTENSLDQVSQELKLLSDGKELNGTSKDPLINKAVELWEKGVSHELFTVLLNQTKIDIDQKGIDSIQVLRNLSKYPPALGMAGTVMGLVTLFSNLTAENKSNLGPALALAMTATFFGLIVTNIIITPLADRLQVKQIAQRRHLSNVYQILCLINRNEAFALVEDEIDSRNKRKGVA